VVTDEKLHWNITLTLPKKGIYIFSSAQ